MLEKKVAHGIASSKMSVLLEDRSSLLFGRRVKKNCLKAVSSVYGHLVH